MNAKALSWSIALIGALALFVYIVFGLLAPGEYTGVFGWPGLHWLTALRFGTANTMIAVAVLGLLLVTLGNFIHHRKASY
jgi:hypothetical protein